MTNLSAPTTVELNRDTVERLAKLADDRRSAPDKLMKEAIEQYVDREEKRQTFHADAAHAWKSYENDGLHLTRLETEDWLDRLASGEDADPPACHD